MRFHNNCVGLQQFDEGETCRETRSFNMSLREQSYMYKKNVLCRTFSCSVWSVLDRFTDWLASLNIHCAAWSAEIMPTLFMFIYCWTIHISTWLRTGHYRHVNCDYFQRAAFLWGRERESGTAKSISSVYKMFYIQTHLMSETNIVFGMIVLLFLPFSFISHQPFCA